MVLRTIKEYTVMMNLHNFKNTLIAFIETTNIKTSANVYPQVFLCCYRMSAFSTWWHINLVIKILIGIILTSRTAMVAQYHGHQDQTTSHHEASWITSFIYLLWQTAFPLPPDSLSLLCPKNVSLVPADMGSSPQSPWPDSPTNPIQPFTF